MISHSLSVSPLSASGGERNIGVKGGRLACQHKPAFLPLLGSRLHSLLNGEGRITAAKVSRNTK